MKEKDNSHIEMLEQSKEQINKLHEIVKKTIQEEELINLMFYFGMQAAQAKYVED